METVLVVFTALLRRGENQPCQKNLVQEVRLCLWISYAPSAQAGDEPEGVEELRRAPALHQKVVSSLWKSKPSVERKHQVNEQG